MNRYSHSTFRNLEGLINNVKNYFSTSTRRLLRIKQALAYLDNNEKNPKKRFDSFSYEQGQDYLDLIDRGLESLKLYEQEFEELIREVSKQAKKDIIYQSESDYKPNKSLGVIDETLDKNEQIELIKSFLENATDSENHNALLFNIEPYWQGEGLEAFKKDINNFRKDILFPLEGEFLKYERYLSASERYENKDLNEYNANLRINFDFLKAPVDERLDCIDSNPKRQAVKNACMQAMTYLDTLKDLSIELGNPDSKIRGYGSDYIIEKVNSCVKMIDYNFNLALTLNPDQLEYDSFMMTEKEIMARLKDAEYFSEQIQNNLSALDTYKHHDENRLEAINKIHQQMRQNERNR